MFKKLLLISFIVGSILNIGNMSAQTIDTTYQSVAQVMSYDAIYGKYPILRGWGSASIISSDGLLLTNNHVVSKENGNPLTTFSICISLSISSRPDCKYTASLVAKDEQRDLALLRINNTDINGSKVDFSKFIPLSLNVDYSPKAQDKTLAIGYPSVGGDTITQTIGVIAGTQEYNDFTYIKTDTAISPGSSGGPLIKDGSIIGINTFTMGGSMGLGYALLASEAHKFVNDNKNLSSEKSIISISDFQLYLKRIDQIQQNKKISDSVFSFSFSKPYVITNYIQNIQVEGKLQTPDDLNVEAFMMRLKNTIAMKSYDDFIYILKTNYGYNPNYHTLQKDMIGGITMYSFVMKNDLSQGEGDGGKVYLAQYGTSTILELILSIPSLEDKNKQDVVKNNVKLFLDDIKFIPGYVLSANQRIIMGHPGLQLSPTKDMITNIVDTADNYVSSWGSYTTPFAILPLKSFHEDITYTLIDNSVELGSTKSVEEKFNITTEGVSSFQKALITYMGHPGFIFCTDQSTDSITYNSEKVTKQGTYVSMGLCRMILYIGNDEDVILQIDLNVEKSKLRSQQRKFLTTIKNTLSLDIIGDGKTILPTQIMKSNKSIFTDTQDQSDGFNNYLSLLVRYGILGQSKILGLEQPMTYKSYLALYLKAIYNISEDKTKLILLDSGINPDSYVDNLYVGGYNDSSLLHTLIKLRLAGIKLPDYSPKTLQKFQLFAQSTYRADWKKIEEFEYNIYGDAKFSIEKVLSNLYDISYVAYNTYTFDPLSGIKKHIIYNDKGSLSNTSFGQISNLNQQDKIISCSNKTMLDKQCMSFYRNLANTIVPSSSLGYYVVTLGEALDGLKYSIDIGLFDDQWKDKKNTMSDE